ncbi:SDR family NAD(P)-dependent oxidoreductase [Candidatus Formimonas warabiya]|nr:SDR family oxidoreductase [Candidatus Formimonas warabiya]
MKLKGKIALIPGGTAGIGEQIALAFAREGATVIVASRNQERVDRVSKAIKAIGTGGGLVADITKKDQVDKMISQVVKEYGKVDIMLNSAGFYPATPVTQISPEEWQMVMDINLTGPFYCAQAAAKEMVKQKYGRIIFITSGQGLRGVPLMAHYSGAKGGLIALARAMAAELGPYGITVNTIAAGLTTTDMVNNNLPPQLLEAVAQNVPVKRLAVPEEYNGAAILLASEDGSYITGETLAVDGGSVNADAVH